MLDMNELPEVRRFDGDHDENLDPLQDPLQ